MSRKTISKRTFHPLLREYKFTGKTKRLFKKFTNKKRFFRANTVIFALCKWNLPIFNLVSRQNGGFCAYFCLFWHHKKPNSTNSKLNLPILNDSIFFALKGKFSRFCESCTILGVYFLHTKSRLSFLKVLHRISKFESRFPKSEYFRRRETKKEHPAWECSCFMLTLGSRWRCVPLPLLR